MENLNSKYEIPMVLTNSALFSERETEPLFSGGMTNTSFGETTVEKLTMFELGVTLWSYISIVYSYWYKEQYKQYLSNRKQQ